MFVTTTFQSLQTHVRCYTQGTKYRDGTVDWEQVECAVLPPGWSQYSRADLQHAWLDQTGYPLLDKEGPGLDPEYNPGGAPRFVLRVGQYVVLSNIRCTASRRGLTCRNKRHGFFLSRTAHRGW